MNENKPNRRQFIASAAAVGALAQPGASLLGGAPETSQHAGEAAQSCQAGSAIDREVFWDHSPNDSYVHGVCPTRQMAERLADRVAGRSEAVPVAGRFEGGMCYRVIDVTVDTAEWTPRHPLDVPAVHEDDERLYVNGEFIDRESALADAAEWNREQLASGADELEWSLVLEYGRLESEREFVHVDFDRMVWAEQLKLPAGRPHIGVAQVSLSRPVRVIHPTADEIRRLAGPLREPAAAPAAEQPDSDEAKHALAQRLTEACSGGFVVAFEPGSILSSTPCDHSGDDPTSVGHAWDGHLPLAPHTEEDLLNWFDADDRQGAVAMQFARKLRNAAAIYAGLAERLEAAAEAGL